MIDAIKKELLESAEIKRRTAETLSEPIAKAVEVIIEAFQKGGKLILAGNGGSAADAQHIATEFMVRYKLERRSLGALALTTDTSALTAIGNDYSFEDLFSRQLEGLGNKGDVFIAITTSGKSPNILKAVRVAKAKGIYTIGFTGKGGGLLKDLVDLAITIPSDSTERIQESHITIGHIISNLVEKRLFS